MSLEGHNSINHHFWRLKNTELSEIFFFMSVRAFALSMITLFVPIYFYKLGLPIQDTIIYYLILYGGTALALYPSTFLVKRIGPKRSVVFSVPLLIIHLILIRMVGTAHISVFWPALLAAFEMPLYWQGYHLDFVLSKTASKAAQQVAVVTIISMIVGALAPLVGGYLTSFFGLSSVIVFGSVVLVIGSLVFFMPVSGKKINEIEYDFSRLKIGRIKRDLIANAGSGIDTAGNAIFWPLFVYLIVGSYQIVGLATTFGLLVTILLTWLIGQRADRGERKKYIKYGDLTSSIVDIVQSFVQNVTHIFVINIFGSLCSSMKTAPYTSEYYLRASENGPGPYVLSMETAINVGRTIMLITLLAASYFLPLKSLCIFAFMFSAVGAVLVLQMPQSRIDIKELHKIENGTVRLNPRPAKK